ncbi:MAG: DNA translocase FtsK [Lachnospiraceae bacterium]|nr:DNA translocase FtsK [Lachnospiraceae bacterium]
MDPALKRELVILAGLATAVLLFCSNMHWCGKFGEALYQVMRGTFGVIGYLVPFYLFLIVCFLLSNEGSTQSVFRVVVSVLLLTVFCGIASLLAISEFDSAVTLKEYYIQAPKSLDGGLLGGLCLKIFYPTLGMVGAYVVLILLAMAGIVVTTQKSLLNPIRKGGKKVYDTAREDLVRRHEIRMEKAEEKKKYRTDKKVRGVSMDTEIVEEREPLPETEPEKRRKPDKRKNPEKEAGEGAADVFTGEIHGMRGAYLAGNEEAGYGQEPESDGEMPYEEENVYIEETGPLKANRIKSTLSELDAMTAKNQEEEEFEPDIPLYQLPTVEEERFSVEESAPPWQEHAAKQKSDFHHKEPGAETNLPWKEDGTGAETERSWKEPGTGQGSGFFQETAEKEITRSDEEASDEVRRIVTAGGKVFEVEQDPTEPDPIATKRARAMEKEPAGKNATEGASVRGESIFRSEGSGRGSSGSVRFSDHPSADRSARPEEKNMGDERRQQAFSRPETLKRPPKPYVKPPMTLLKQGDQKVKNRDAELKETAIKLQQTLRNFGVGVTVTHISCGPSVTRYELTPEQGVKVSRIVSLTDDIKLNLAAADIRIEAPIPGKSAVGIEVPNRENMTVAFRDVIESEEFQKFPSKLAFAVGRDIAGQTVVTDMAKMPHLLIAGATGSGKSVCINTLIMSILYKAEPSEVKLIMIDPKVVELSIYNGIPHLMIPVVTDPKKAAGALNWAVAEMTDRYKKFAQFNVRDLKGYNEKLKSEASDGEETVPLPHVVIIVDELSDLMMVSPGEVEDAICRLAQMARAAGIHLVLATQRPSVNVITGLIKANVPSRIAFSVSSGVDSRTIIDMNGAEKLLGKGDMLFYPSGYQKPVRVQGAFVSDGEVSKVVEFLAENAETDYSQDVENRVNASSGYEGAGGAGERDPYFADAGRFLIEKEKGSIGMLQRAFKVGFNRAARIMDQLAQAGVVGEEEGTKPRKVLMSLEEFEELLEYP